MKWSRYWIFFMLRQEDFQAIVFLCTKLTQSSKVCKDITPSSDRGTTQSCPIFHGCVTLVRENSIVEASQGFTRDGSEGQLPNSACHTNSLKACYRYFSCSPLAPLLRGNIRRNFYSWGLAGALVRRSMCSGLKVKWYQYS